MFAEKHNRHFCAKVARCLVGIDQSDILIDWWGTCENTRHLNDFLTPSFSPTVSEKTRLSGSTGNQAQKAQSTLFGNGKDGAEAKLKAATSAVFCRGGVLPQCKQCALYCLL